MMYLWQIVDRRIMQNKPLWRALTLLFCALVLFFALHAKTAVYNNGSAAKVTPSTASKLWVSGEKIEMHALESSATGVLFWMAILCLIGWYFRAERIVPAVFAMPAPRMFALQDLHRFLRPPPVLL